LAPQYNVDRRLFKTPVTQIFLAVAIAALYLLHQDVWFWRTAHPLVFGFLPVALAYHAAYCIAASALMWALTKMAWPRHLEEESRR
jgi:hypothetical protein